MKLSRIVSVLAAGSLLALGCAVEEGDKANVPDPGSYGAQGVVPGNDYGVPHDDYGVPRDDYGNPGGSSEGGGGGGGGDARCRQLCGIAVELACSEGPQSLEECEQEVCREWITGDCTREGRALLDCLGGVSPESWACNDDGQVGLPEQCASQAFAWASCRGSIDVE